MELITIYDVILAPIYLFILYFITLRFSFRFIKEPSLRFFYKYGIITKIIGSISALLIYIYYYNGGDTLQYYYVAKILSNFINENPECIFEVLFSKDLSHYSNFAFLKYKYINSYINDHNTYIVGKIGYLFYILSLGSIVCTYILCAFFSFWTSWKFYSIFYEKYPHLIRPIGYAIFFMPSTIFWGSGLFKDTFTLGGLYLFIYSILNIFIYKKLYLINILYLLISYYLLVSIRSFFIISILPFMFIWVFFHYYNLIQNKKFKWLFFPVFLVVLSAIGIVGFQIVNTYLIVESLESIENKIAGFQSWHSSLGGSSYSLGNFDFTIGGYIQLFFPSIIVTLFRPFIWEVNKFIVFLSSLQGMFFMYYTLNVLITTKVYYFFKIIFREYLVFSLLGFSLFFAYITGLTSYNFGALDRYKIPCLSTYIISLILIQHFYKNRTKIS